MVSQLMSVFGDERYDKACDFDHIQNKCRPTIVEKLGLTLAGFFGFTGFGDHLFDEAHFVGRDLLSPEHTQNTFIYCTVKELVQESRRSFFDGVDRFVKIRSLNVSAFDKPLVTHDAEQRLHGGNGAFALEA
jgi:hypothetical protein